MYSDIEKLVALCIKAYNLNINYIYTNSSEKIEGVLNNYSLNSVHERLLFNRITNTDNKYVVALSNKYYNDIMHMLEKIYYVNKRDAVNIAMILVNNYGIKDDTKLTKKVYLKDAILEKSIVELIIPPEKSKYVELCGVPIPISSDDEPLQDIGKKIIFENGDVIRYESHYSDLRSPNKYILSQYILDIMPKLVSELNKRCNETK